MLTLTVSWITSAWWSTTHHTSCSKDFSLAALVVSCSVLVSRFRSCSHAAAVTMNIYISSSSLTSRVMQDVVIPCNIYYRHTSLVRRTEMSWQQRDGGGGNKTNNKLKHLIFICLGSGSDYESFTERTIITAQVETWHQMRKLWPTSTQPQVLSGPSLTLMTDDCDRGFMNSAATLNSTMSNVACA